MTNKEIINKMREALQELGPQANIGVTTTVLFNIAHEAIVNRHAELAEHPRYQTLQAGMAGQYIADDLRKTIEPGA